jgi:hypothetical protein
MSGIDLPGEICGRGFACHSSHTWKLEALTAKKLAWRGILKLK